jgi:hypothetical protein
VARDSARVTAFYNDFEPHAAQWLRNLVSAGHIAPGFVDGRSITKLESNPNVDLREFDQVHLFAGIGACQRFRVRARARAIRVMVLAHRTPRFPAAIARGKICGHHHGLGKVDLIHR